MDRRDHSLDVGFVHTVPRLARYFEDLLRAQRPAARPVHVAEAWLLGRTIEAGLTGEVIDRVVGHCRALAAAGASAVLVTCSSIGEAAERADAILDIPVLRVDAAMAAEAVRLASLQGSSGRIVVLATVESTLEPTARLISRIAGSRPLTVDVRLCTGAATARASGDQAEHDRIVSEHICAASGVDAVVLAQASMAAAADAVRVPHVLTSPGGGVQSLVERMERP